MAKGITFFSKLSSLVANATFFIKNADFDEITSRVVLKNTEDANSGVQIDNLQGYVNQLAEVSGIIENDPDRLNYISENYITDGDTQKECIENLDEQVGFNADDILDRLTRLPNDYTAFTEKVLPVEDDFVLIEDSEDSFGKKKLKLKNMIGNAVGFGEIPSGLVNGVNVDFTVTKAPSSDGSILVFVNGRNIGNNFSYNLSVITLNEAPVLGQEVFVWYLTDGSPSAPVTVSGTQNVQYPIITSGDISAKQITLPTTPAVPTLVVLDVIGGPPQVYGQDFQVVGSILTWNGLNLENEINVNDQLRIQYLS